MKHFNEGRDFVMFLDSLLNLNIRLERARFIVRNLGQEVELLNGTKIALNSKMSVFASQNFNDSVSLFHRTKHQNSKHLRVKSKNCKDYVILSKTHWSSRSNDGSTYFSVNSGKIHTMIILSLWEAKEELTVATINNYDFPESIKINHNKNLKESVVVSGKRKYSDHDNDSLSVSRKWTNLPYPARKISPPPSSPVSLIGTNHSDKLCLSPDMHEHYGSSIGTSQSGMFNRHTNEQKMFEYFNRSCTPPPIKQCLPCDNFRSPSIHSSTSKTWSET